MVLLNLGVNRLLYLTFNSPSFKINNVYINFSKLNWIKQIINLTLKIKKKDKIQGVTLIDIYQESTKPTVYLSNRNFNN